MTATRVAILFSGRGSNMQSLAAHMARPDVPAEWVLAITNRPDAAGIEFCRTQDVPCAVVDHKGFTDRASFEHEMQNQLEAARVELICAAGFMRLLTPEFVTRWTDRLINVHPSLLPAHKGLHTHQRALDAGDTKHGCTVHYMRPEMDDGPIIVQKSVPVQAGDTAESLAARVLEQEHLAYPEALNIVLETLRR